ncbi:LysR family transcriptional regulator [Sphingomonas morindae]|uniref:LysR family transcriptional regulator n=1 Tax=Sphingomonas morindae TaxID=1541170 RepID=A0ABY4X3Q4_9SPHN|nr:LysR family transcriptional regulator [Sphingomonas morindae]USI71525.1 LysR family transcriptional regulator [Sphingomonas morindae]
MTAPVNRADLADFAYFLAIARHRNFRLAGLELGVTASAISHALKGLEQRLGVRLVNRTNRSVMLSAAGERLHESLEGPFAQIGEAVDALNQYRDAPNGRIRLNVVGDAAHLLVAPVMGEFAERYPEIEVDLVSSNRMVDVTAGGFDAGIRHGGTVPEDMIAQRLSADLRWIVAASPAYLEKHGTPLAPADLAGHCCLGVRLGDERIYRWEFDGPNGEFDLAVPSNIVADHSQAMIAMAVAGAGLTYGVDAALRPWIEAGLLSPVLLDHAVTGPGYHIYYPSRRQLPAALRLFIDLIRERRPLGL